MMPLALGIDGGGTRTRVCVGSSERNLEGSGASGPCNIAIVPVADAAASIKAAAEEALGEAGSAFEDVGAVCGGIAGFSFAARVAELQAALEALFPHAEIVLVPDFAVALTGGLGESGAKAGIIVIAGTGSVAYGEDENGRSHRTGAYGYLIDDAGSGYGVGRLALAAVLRAADGTGAATAMTGRVFETLGLSSTTQIVPGVYGGEISRVRIASLAPIVAAASADGDAVAQAVLMRAGGALAQLVQGVTAALFSDAAHEIPLVRVGGLWDAGPVLSDVFARSVNRFAPSVTLVEAQQTPVAGALRRAIDLLD